MALDDQAKILHFSYSFSGTLMLRRKSRLPLRGSKSDHNAVRRFLIYGLEERPTAHDFIHVEAIEDRLEVHNWNVRPHMHPALHQFMLFRDGVGEFLIEDAWHPFHAPVLIVAPAGTVHGFRFAQGTSGPVVTIAEAFFEQIAAGIDADILSAFDHAQLLPLSEAEVAEHGLEETFAAIAREYRWAASGKIAAISALVALLLITISRLSARERGSNRHEGRHDHLFACFRLAVESHFKDSWPLSQYASELGVTTARLNRACRAVVQSSALEIVHKRILAEAKRSLLYTMMTTSQIAYSLGFKDPAYFSRWFRKHVGDTPGLFRARRGRSVDELLGEVTRMVP